MQSLYHKLVCGIFVYYKEESLTKDVLSIQIDKDETGKNKK